MDEKEIVKKYLSDDDCIMENDLLINLMYPLADFTNTINEGKTPTRDQIENIRNSIQFFKGLFDDIDRLLELASESIEDEGA